jgi:hypothetical protein
MKHNEHHHHNHQHDLSHFGHSPMSEKSSSFYNVTSENTFCSGHGSIMYMDGFHFSLFTAASEEQPCLNLFFPTWTLDTPIKFVFGGICVPLVMGYVTEAFMLGIARKGTNTTTPFQKSVLHVLQSLLGFVDMVLFMSLSCEIIASLMLGFWLGFFSYHRKRIVSTSSKDASLDK